MSDETKPNPPAIPVSSGADAAKNSDLTKLLFDFGKAAQLASDDTGLLRMTLRLVTGKEFRSLLEKTRDEA